MKDRELTRLLQAHPEEGLEAAMLEYAPLVKGILCRILPQNPCDREECMADVFVALWRSAAKLEATCTPLRPWLAVAARNRAIDCYNALRRRETVTLDDGMAETLGELAEFDRATTSAPTLSVRWWRLWRRRTGIFFCANIICCNRVRKSPLRWV